MTMEPYVSPETPDNRYEQHIVYPPTIAECRERLIILADEIQNIKNQISDADLRRQAGDPPDRRWLNRARTALRCRNHERAMLNAHVMKLRLEQYAQRPRGPSRKERFKDCLIEVLRADYSDDDWQHALDEAHGLLETLPNGRGEDQTPSSAGDTA